MRQYVVLLSLAASFLLLVPPSVVFASGFIENQIDWVQLRHEKAALKTTYFENTDTPKSVQDFTPDFIKHHFKPTPENHSFGFSKNRYWFYTEINIRNLAGSEYHERFEAFLEIAYPHLDNLWVYDLSAYNSGTQTTIDLMNHLGDRQPHKNRPIASTTYKIPVSLEPDKTLKLLIFVHSTSSIQLPIYLWHPDSLLEQTQNLSLVYGIYFGITVVMALYNLFLGFSIRDISYFYYVGSIVLFALLQATLWGYSFQYFWPEQITFNEKSIPLLTFSVIVVDALFSRAFLQTAKNHRILDRVLLAIAFMNTLAFLAACLFLPYQLAINIAIWSALLLCTVLLYTGIKLWRKGVIQARFYVLAWAVLLIGSVIYGFSIKGVLPINSITLHAAQLGSALEVIFLSFALADRINRMRLEKQEVERSTKLAMEEKNRDLNQILEALRKSNTVKDQFLATISHELRTPMHGIQSALELLTADRPESQDQTHLTAARSCAGHMTQMVESLL
ncbi:MAG: hypothetical protein MI864_25665, partial [Pseudomonadales bacterium]|nr:hypothetical protein [Pseudomonadales bacterium]